jgi:RecA/RadA recombinase
MTAVREQLEALLGARNLGGTLLPPWALTPGVRVLSTGVPSLDARFGGGWRQGELSELVARRSAGRTSVLAASLAVATADGGVAALVDALDRLDPPSLEAAGADLSRVLWVRGPAVTVEMARPALTEDIVHRAVRAFDLILRAGGFTLAALDLTDVPPRAVRALPWATWRRLAHANEGRATVALLVGDGPMGRSARGVSIALSTRTRWMGTSDQSRRFGGFDMKTMGTAGMTDTAGSRSARAHAISS